MSDDREHGPRFRYPDPVCPDDFDEHVSVSVDG